MSLLPRTSPLAECPLCGKVHLPGQPACPAGPDPAPGSLPPSPTDAPPQIEPAPLSPLLSAEAKPAYPASRPLSDEKIRALLDQGIVVEEDAHGLRLSGMPVLGRGKGTGQLSASDIVRLAADLDGGVLPADQRRHCPHCDAVVPPRASRCEWCGKSLDAPPT